MKYSIILILLLISISLSFNLSYISIDKYGKYKIKNFTESYVVFTLDIREIKNNNNNFIYLKFSSSNQIYNSGILYSWSYENYKNITFIQAYNFYTNIKCVARKTEIFDHITYSHYCSFNNKNNSYNTLIIKVYRRIPEKNVAYNNFEIYHNKYNIIKIIHIISISIAVFVISEIIFGICYYKSRYEKYNEYINEKENNNLITPNGNNNNEQYTPPTPNI